MLFHRAPYQHSFTARKVVVMSGLSDPLTCALNEEQTKFVDALPIKDEEKLRWNFPYVPCPDRAFQAPHLWLASYRNLRHFLTASTRAFRHTARPHWHALLESTPELIVLTLSCGMEILNGLQRISNGQARVRVIGLGPVAWHKPRWPHYVIQGESDWLSRSFFRKADVRIAGVGHMDYFRHPQVFHRVCEQLRCNTSK
jgi:hypothetical protein